MSIETILTIGQTIFISLFIFYWQRKQSKHDKAALERAEARKKEGLLGLKLANTNSELSYACAMALKRGKANGEVEKAVESYKEAKQEYELFMTTQAKNHLEEIIKL